MSTALMILGIAFAANIVVMGVILLCLTWHWLREQDPVMCSQEAKP